MFKNLIKTIFFTAFYFLHNLITFADAGILGWVNENQLRSGEIHTDDIPNIIKFAIDFIMWFAWTIAVIFIIIGSYQILFWSVSGDKSKWQATIKLALGGFALAACAWIIIKIVIDNFS